MTVATHAAPTSDACLCLGTKRRANPGVSVYEACTLFLNRNAPFSDASPELTSPEQVARLLGWEHCRRHRHPHYPLKASIAITPASDGTKWINRRLTGDKLATDEPLCVSFPPPNHSLPPSYGAPLLRPHSFLRCDSDPASRHHRL